MNVKIKIYQIKIQADIYGSKFVGSNSRGSCVLKLYDANIIPDRLYDLVYSSMMSLEEENSAGLTDILDYIFMLFNQDKKPEGFLSHSLSVSDVVQIDTDGAMPGIDGLYYCDTMGWLKVEWGDTNG